MAIAYLIHGYLGVGKTTFAKQLEKKENAVRFTHDEWMAQLYGPDPDEKMFPLYFQNVSRLIDTIWPRCLELGVNVVLDLNFWSKQQRDETRKIITDLKCEYKFFEIKCSDNLAWSRIEMRNNDPHFNGLHISWNTYNTLKRKFEPLNTEETHEIIDTSVNKEY